MYSLNITVRADVNDVRNSKANASVYLVAQSVLDDDLRFVIGSLPVIYGE